MEYVEPEDTDAVDPLANEEAAEEEEAFEDGEEKPTPPTGGQDGSSSSPSSSVDDSYRDRGELRQKGKNLLRMYP